MTEWENCRKQGKTENGWKPVTIRKKTRSGKPSEVNLRDVLYKLINLIV